MLAITVVNVLFPTPPFWLEKAMNFVLFVASISILFLSFYFRGLPAVLHGAGLLSLHTVRQSSYNAVIPAFTRAKPMACLSSCLFEWLPDSFHVVRYSCSPSFTTAIGSGCLQTGLRD